MLGSLRSRLVLTNLFVTLIGLLVLAIVFSQLLRQHSIDIEQSEVQHQAKSLRDDVDRELGRVAHLTPSQFRAFFAHDSELLNKHVIWFNASGSCAFDSRVFQLEHGRGSGDPCRIPGLSDWQIVPVSSGRAASEFVHRGNQTYLVYQEPTSAPGEQKTAVVLVTNASAVIPSLTELFGVFLLAALAAAIVWVLMSLYFAYGVSRPLLSVAQAARAMARGDYSQRVKVRGSGEIAELGGSFNEMASRVEASHQLLKDFVANVSHDLRTPLTLISGYAGALVDGTAHDRREVTESAKIIVDESASMQRLVEDLLRLTRLESGLITFDPQSIALKEVVDRVVRRVEATCHDSHTIRNEIDTGLPPARVDGEQIDRALTNLVSNAVQHTPTGTDVSIRARPKDSQWIEVTVHDNGPGIRPEDQDRVFERFYRLDRGRRRNEGHSGLGLAIVKEIVQAHGGTLEVASVEGQGASFSFTIPRA